MFKSSEKDGSRVADTVENAMEGSAGYPGSYAVTSLRERRILLSLRIVSISLIFSMIISAVLAFILMSLLPLKEVRPFLVQIADQGSIADSIKPLEDRFDSMDILTEKLVREYVINRNEILRSDAVMADRWSDGGYLGMTTSVPEYRRFVAQVADQLEEIRRLDGQMRIEILSVSAVRTGQVYVIDYRATAYNSLDAVVDDRVYTATIEIAFTNLAGRTRNQMLINPTGFTVISHSIAEKKQ